MPSNNNSLIFWLFLSLFATTVRYYILTDSTGAYFDFQNINERLYEKMKLIRLQIILKKYLKEKT